MNKDEYDINTYSDQECFDILNINNPSDRELEMKILQHMDNYENKSKRLYRFFESMYDRFFSEEDEDEDDVVEGMQNKDVTNPVAPTAPATTNNQAATTNNQAATTTTNPFFGLPTSGTTIINTIDTHNVDYVKDHLKLNPVERKTIFKMISIDSQFREDPGNTSATNFTMNLSESIDNVISTKLYSVQIPYTWYTINESFGSNFFFIKGNSPGINNGDHDIKVDIPSGTYTAPEIVTAINAKFDFLKNVKDNELYNSVLDLSLGETKISYNKDANNAKVVLELDLKKKYNETDYQLFFPYWTDPNDTKNRTLSIPSFLGFNYDTYYPYIAYSNMTVPPIDNSNSISNFIVNSTNNYFTIYHYTGTNAFDISSSTIINEIRITFSLPYTAYSRITLENDIKKQLALNPLLDQTVSRFERINNTTTDLSNAHYEIAIKLNRKKIIQTDNSKLAIVFPNEISENQPPHIWTGNNSCFIFKNDINELNEIISETPAVITNYIIEPSSAIIKIECIKPYYDVSENTRIATVAPSTSAEGYLLSEYIDAINTAIVTMNNQTILDNPVRPLGEFIIGQNGAYNTNLSIVSDKATFKFDILREFTQKTYIVDLSDCFLSKDPFFFNKSYDNLTDSSFSFIRDFSGAASYPINNSNNKLVLIPKKTGGPNNLGYGNQNSPNIELYFTNLTYTTTQDFINGINSNFASFKDSDNYKIMEGSSIALLGNKLTLQLKVSKILNESNYKVTFIDDNLIPDNSLNSWNAYLQIDPSFNLSGFDLSNNIVNNTQSSESSHAEILGITTIYTNNIQLTTLKNKFIFKPYTNGVADSNGANDIIIEIPAATATTYTRDGLINVIQDLFTQNPLTNGSTISLVIDGNNQYTKLRININKTFYSEDFKLVLYDSVSFVYCNVGVAQNATWDSTLGWLLGFQKLPEYPLSELINSESAFEYENNYLTNIYNFPSSSSGSGYTNSYNSTNRKIAIIGDVVLNTNLYNYFLIVLDDFIQNHVNAGLITITSLEADVALPSYASRVSYQCDPVTGIKTAVSATNKLNTNLSSKQLYAMNQIIDAKRTKLKSYASGPYLKDVFALIPMKLSGMLFGQTYMEFGGTMQNQDRKYYGPVRIQKLSVKLMNDKGQQVNLNGANFSICIICEILNTKS